MLSFGTGPFMVTEGNDLGLLINFGSIPADGIDTTLSFSVTSALNTAGKFVLIFSKF